MSYIRMVQFNIIWLSTKGLTTGSRESNHRHCRHGIGRVDFWSCREGRAEDERTDGVDGFQQMDGLLGQMIHMVEQTEYRFTSTRHLIQQ